MINHYFIRQRTGQWLLHLVLPLVGMSIILYVLFEMDRLAQIMGTTWLAIGIIYFLVLAFWIKKPVAIEIS